MATSNKISHTSSLESLYAISTYSTTASAKLRLAQTIYICTLYILICIGEGVLIPTGIVVLQRGSNTIVCTCRHHQYQPAMAGCCCSSTAQPTTTTNFVCLNWCGLTNAKKCRIFSCEVPSRLGFFTPGKNCLTNQRTPN